MTLLDALWLLLPVMAAGAAHFAVVELDLWPALARLPLDLELCFRDKRVFGDSKSARGLVVIPTVTMLFSALQAAPVLWGLALGLGYVLGELPNSFVKRQLDIAPGQAAPGPLKPLFWVLDRTAGPAGALGAIVLYGLPGAGWETWAVAGFVGAGK